MTGKEALDDYKDFGKIKGESTTSNHTFVPSDYHYEWKEEENLEYELDKYKRAFEILKEKGIVEISKHTNLGSFIYQAYGFDRYLDKAEYELLEELMKELGN